MDEVLKIEIKGIEETNKVLSIKNKAVAKAVEHAMVKVSHHMEGEIKESIAGRKSLPTTVDTGRFLNSVKGTNDKLSATISTNVEYAKYLEYGTSRMSARPHFRNTLSMNRNKIKVYFQDQVNII